MAKLEGISASEGLIPDIDWQAEKKAAEILQNMREKGQFLAARAVGQGGAGLAAVKMLLGGNCQLSTETVVMEGLSVEELLGERTASYVLELDLRVDQDETNQLLQAFWICSKAIDEKRKTRQFAWAINAFRTDDLGRNVTGVGS